MRSYIQRNAERIGDRVYEASMIGMTSLYIALAKLSMNQYLAGKNGYLIVVAGMCTSIAALGPIAIYQFRKLLRQEEPGFL